MTAVRQKNETGTVEKPLQAIYAGRYTARADEPFVVFLIGIRFNNLHGLPSALRTFFAMPKMLAELQTNPALGLLDSRVSFDWHSATLVQYWRSFDDLERFARSPDRSHLGPWRWFARLGKKSNGVGIWHETYTVAPGNYEAIYVNMPRFGLAAATTHRPIDAPRDEAARTRIAV